MRIERSALVGFTSASRQATELLVKVSSNPFLLTQIPLFTLIQLARTPAHGPRRSVPLSETLSPLVLLPQLAPFSPPHSTDMASTSNTQTIHQTTSTLLSRALPALPFGREKEPVLPFASSDVEGVEVEDDYNGESGYCDVMLPHSSLLSP